MNFQKILPEQLEIGMRIVVAEPFYYGWHSRTGLTRYRHYTISRITPKRTKIICGDDEFLIKDTVFYVPHEEMDVEIDESMRSFISKNSYTNWKTQFRQDLLVQLMKWKIA